MNIFNYKDILTFYALSMLVEYTKSIKAARPVADGAAPKDA